jgi:hypothetical protein
VKSMQWSKRQWNSGEGRIERGPCFDGTNLRKEWVTACAACELGRKIEVESKPDRRGGRR